MRSHKTESFKMILKYFRAATAACLLALLTSPATAQETLDFEVVNYTANDFSSYVVVGLTSEGLEEEYVNRGLGIPAGGSGRITIRCVSSMTYEITAGVTDLRSDTTTLQTIRSSSGSNICGGTTRIVFR